MDINEIRRGISFWLMMAFIAGSSMSLIHKPLISLAVGGVCGWMCGLMGSFLAKKISGGA